MSLWDISDRGFLPSQDPITALSNYDQKYIPLVNRLENITVMLPVWLEERRVREELVHNLREVSGFLDEDFFGQESVHLERLMHIFSYMASAYVYARYETPAARLPVEIAAPLVFVADKIGRKPILSYASYCLTNWEKLDKNKEIALDNIKLLTNFCHPEVGQRDENWFILIHVVIEHQAAQGVSACLSNQNLEELLTKIHTSLVGMNATLARMPEQCDPDNYYRWVRPYIFSFNNIIYEGCFDNKPVTFRGETGAQSSIIPAFIAALGIKHQDSMLTHHLREMRDYMPAPHRQFLSNLEQSDANNSVRALIGSEAWRLKHLYNECIREVIRFREKHFEYAVNYIAKKVENPAGTGGTPYIEWLRQLKEETEQHILA